MTKREKVFITAMAFLIGLLLPFGFRAMIKLMEYDIALRAHILSWIKQ